MKNFVAIFEEGTLVVGAAVSGAVFGEAVSVNYRIELVLLPSRNECYCGRHDCNNDLYQAEYLYLFKCIASLITSQACYRAHIALLSCSHRLYLTGKGLDHGAQITELRSTRQPHMIHISRDPSNDATYKQPTG